MFIFQPMYPTASEDATEEPLHWEPSDDLEFDDEFQLTRNSTFLRDVISRRPVKEELKVKHSFRYLYGNPYAKFSVI